MFSKFAFRNKPALRKSLKLALLRKNWLQAFDKTKYILVQSKWDNQKAENISGWKMSPIKKTEIKNIDDLGIVAGLIHEIGIVERINSKLGIDSREKIASGILVKAILINGLGFVSRPLYLFSHFLYDKGIKMFLW